MATPDNDVLETLGRPEYPAAVQWSEDNLVAVAAGPAVLVINPCQLRGPRGSTALPEPAVDVLQVAQYPATPKDSVTYAATYLRTRGLCNQRNSQLASSKLGIRSVCWSPLGCDLPGNTLLTSVTENHQVRVHSPPVGCQTQWHTVVELSSKLKQILLEENWQSIDKLQTSVPLSAAEHLRLRGGAPSGRRSQTSDATQQQVSPPQQSAKETASPSHQKQATAPAQAETEADQQNSRISQPLSSPAHEYHAGELIEVMSGEEGLQGSWFTGTVTQLQHGFALVAYHELNVSEDSNEKLQEWFPLPGAVAENQSLLGVNHDANFGPDFHIRPQPPAELAVRGGMRAVQDDVDAFDDGGWWEGRITQTFKARIKVKPFISANVLSVKREDVRTGVAWDGRAWNLRQPRERKVAQPADNQTKKEAMRAARKRKHADPLTVKSDGSGEESSDAEDASRKSWTKSHKPAPYKLPEGFSVGDLPDVQVTSNKAGRAALARASAACFFELRQEVPEDQLPKYKNHKDHLAAVDADLVSRVATEFWAAFSDDMTQHEISRQQYVKGFREKLRLSWDRVLDPKAKHVQLDKRVRGAQANVDLSHILPSDSALHSDASISAQDSDDDAEVAPISSKPEAYQVPANFDKSILGEVDVSSKDAAELGLPHAFWLRWMQLRDQIPEHKRESYAKGQHLRGADAQNADRTRAEIVATFGEDMTKHGLSEKQLVTLGKQLIRNRIIQTQAVFASRPKKEWTAEEEQRLRKLAKRRRTPSGMSDDDTQLWEEVPAYTVPAEFDKTCLGAVDTSSKEKARKSLPQAFKQRWRDLRSKMAESEVPVYTTNEHFQGIDARNAEQTRAEMMTGYGAEMQGLGFTEAWLMAAGKQLIWQRFLQAKHRKRAKSLQTPEDGAGNQAGLRPAKKASSKQSAAAEAEAAEERYEVPADFDAAVLGTPDFSSTGMAEKTMAALFLKRWWELRSKDPEAVHETYKKGQHLRGVDAANAERVRAEMMSAFHDQMQELNMSEKILVRDGKRAIRADLKTSQQPSDLLDDAPAEELDDDVTLVKDGTGRRPRRKAAVSASKTLRATRDSPDAPSSDDEYKGATEQEGEEAISDEEDADSPTEDDDEDVNDVDEGLPDVPAAKKKRKMAAPRASRQAGAGGARSVSDKPVPMNLTAQAYLQRMDSLAALQAAWSPVCALPATGDTGVHRFAMLAVGCKAGIVWLWRYRIPTQYSPSGSAAPQAFSLVGGFIAQRLHSQSVQSLGEATVQSAGALLEGELMQLRKTLHEADLLGVTCLSVKLHKAPTSGQPELLVAAGKSGGALVTCSISMYKPPPAAPRPPKASLTLSVELQYSPAQVCRGAHSTKHVTGVAWATTHIALTQQQSSEQGQQQQQQQLPQQQSQLQQALLLSCGGDSRVRQWRASFGAGAEGLVEADCPKAWNCPSLEKDAAFSPGGLAVSGNGLVMAVAADNGTTAIAAVQQDMIYKRLYNGNVVIHSLCGSYPHLLDSATAVTAVADQLCKVALHPNRLWDIAHVLKQHAAAAVAAAAITAASAAASSAAAAAEDRVPAEAAGSSVPEAEAGAAAEADSGCSPAQGREPVMSAGGTGDAQEGQQAQQAGAGSASRHHADPVADAPADRDVLTLDQAVAESALVQAVLAALEQPYYQLQEAQYDVKVQAHGPVWQGLQCATALRRLLHPCKLLPQQPDVCEEPPWQQLATATHLNQAPLPQSAVEAASKPHILDWERALQRDELQLLQLHVRQQLSCPGKDLEEEEARVSEVVMADWVTMHAGHTWLHPALLQLAQQVHSKHGITDPASPEHVAARERSDWFGVDLCLQGTPLSSARSIPASEAIPISMQRCAASLLVCSRIAVNGDADVVTVTGSASEFSAAVNLLQAQLASWRSSAACAYPHPTEVKYVLKGAATTESQLVFMAATAGAVTQATDLSGSLYQLHVKPSAAPQLPVGRVRNALHETSASLMASMTALSINTPKQFHLKEEIPSLLSDMTAAAEQTAAGNPKIGDLKVTLNIGSQFFYAGKTMQVPEHQFTLDVMNAINETRHDQGLKSVYSNAVDSTQFKDLKHYITNRTAFKHVAAKETASVHVKDLDLNTSLVIAFNASGGELHLRKIKSGSIKPFLLTLMHQQPSPDVRLKLIAQHFFAKDGLEERSLRKIISETTLSNGQLLVPCSSSQAVDSHIKTKDVYEGMYKGQIICVAFNTVRGEAGQDHHEITGRVPALNEALKKAVKAGRADMCQLMKEEVATKRAKLECMQVDLASFSSIKDFSNKFLDSGTPLHVLINNAGVFIPPDDRTEEDFEVTMGIDHFAPFYMTHLLLQNLEQNAPSRIVNLGSMAESYAPADWKSALTGRQFERSGMQAYGAAKLFNIMLAKEYSKRLKGKKIDAFAAHPGTAKTAIWDKMDKEKVEGVAFDLTAKPTSQSQETGALPVIRAATDPTLTGQGFKYFGPFYKGPINANIGNEEERTTTNPVADDMNACKELYDMTLEIVGQKAPEILDLAMPA
ncbi:hypothetical protein WJX77_010878 [Trebouxia sp. C0004]